MNTRKINLSDPEFEPTDEELQSLSSRAFSHIPAQNKKLLEKLRENIAEARKLVLDRLDK